MSEVTFTDSNFEQEVLHEKGLVLVDFSAPWCPPCKMMAPTIEKLAQEYHGKVKIGKLDTDENQVTGTKYQIQGVPTLIFFKGGTIVDRLDGFQNADTLKAKLDALQSVSE